MSVEAVAEVYSYKQMHQCIETGWIRRGSSVKQTEYIRRFKRSLVFSCWFIPQVGLSLYESYEIF